MAYIMVLLSVPFILRSCNETQKVSSKSLYSQGRVYAVNESTLYVEGFSYDGTGEEAQFYAGRAGEEGTLLSPTGEPAAVLEQLENRNLYLRYTLSAHSSCTIAGHRHSGILYLLFPLFRYGPVPASTFLFIPVPD